METRIHNRGGRVRVASDQSSRASSHSSGGQSRVSRESSLLSSADTASASSVSLCAPLYSSDQVLSWAARQRGGIPEPQWIGGSVRHQIATPSLARPTPVREAGATVLWHDIPRAGACDDTCDLLSDRDRNLEEKMRDLMLMGEDAGLLLTDCAHLLECKLPRRGNERDQGE